MSDHRFTGRYSRTTVDIYLMADDNVTPLPDGAVLVEMVTADEMSTVFSREAVTVDPGLYRVMISSQETATPGYYMLKWTYDAQGVPQIAVVDLEVAPHQTPTWDGLTPLQREIVQSVWMRFDDAFDSAVGGPHLQMYRQASFSRERVSQLLKIALASLNSISPVTYTLDNFPYEVWGGVLERSLYIETISHLIRSYTEQAQAQNIQKARLDRTNYANYWRSVKQDEMPGFERALAEYRQSTLNLGASNVIVAGGIYGEYPALSRPVGRPRARLPFGTW